MIAPALSVLDGAVGQWWPAAAMRAASVSPEVSSAALRVSDTVSTAMLTGMKGRLSSMRAMGCSGRPAPSVQAGGRFLGGSRGMIARPVADGEFVQARRGQAQPGGVDPGVGERARHEGARLVQRDRLDEQQRVAVVVDRGRSSG